MSPGKWLKELGSETRRCKSSCLTNRTGQFSANKLQDLEDTKNIQLSINQVKIEYNKTESIGLDDKHDSTVYCRNKSRSNLAKDL